MPTATREHNPACIHDADNPAWTKIAITEEEVLTAAMEEVEVLDQCGRVRWEEDTLKNILDDLSLGIVVCDCQGKLLFVNDAIRKILGHDVVKSPRLLFDSVAGWYSADQVTILTPDQLPMARAIRGERVRDELVFVRHFQWPEGTWIRVSAWPLRTESGSIEGGVVLIQDFSARRRESQRLELLSRVAEQTADSVIITDPQGVIQYVNPAFENTTGYRRDEAAGKTPRLLKSGLHDPEFYRQIWARLETGQHVRGMIINRKKSGELYWAHQTITPMLDKAGRCTHFLSVLQDVTQLRREKEQKYQLQLARSVQQQFYPVPPSVEGFDIGAAAHPADETGGDYFDFIQMGDGTLMIAVGDVKGHGFGAALVMAVTRAYLRCFARLRLGLDEILKHVNEMLLNDLQDGHFVTLVLAHLDPHEHTLAHASAGHVPGFVFDQSGKVSSVLDSTGPPLALFREVGFETRKIHLEPGQAALFTTDGLMESTTPEGEEFGTDRVLDYFKSHRNEIAQRIANGLYQDVRRFVKNDPQDDDITAVVIKVAEEIETMRGIQS
jgi:PAS domain S-box-containing protein